MKRESEYFYAIKNVLEQYKESVDSNIADFPAICS